MSHDNDKRIVSVSTERESGGITATVVTSDGEVYTGRSHWSNTFMGRGEASESEAIKDAVKKIDD